MSDTIGLGVFEDDLLLVDEVCGIFVDVETTCCMSSLKNPLLIPANWIFAAFKFTIDAWFCMKVWLELNSGCCCWLTNEP